MVFSVSFQNPVNGTPSRAQFVAGRLTVYTYTDSDNPRLTRDLSPQQLADLKVSEAEAEAAAKQVSGRYRSLAAASAALERFGVDIASEGGWEQSYR